mgnify:CR=1 FL=1
MEEKFYRRYESFKNSLDALNEAKNRDLSDSFVLSGTGAKFTCGHTYKVSFSLSTKDDYEFGNITAKLNGNNAESDWYNPYLVTVTYTFDELTCAPEFVEGEFPSCSGTGHIGYFACPCGKWYWDAEGTEPIENEEDIEWLKANGGGGGGGSGSGGYGAVTSNSRDQTSWDVWVANKDGRNSSGEVTRPHDPYP